MNRQDPTLKGLNRRVGDLEVRTDKLQASLDKLVTLTQRIQWTFTGLGIYYIMDNGEIAKLLAKAIMI